jgi:hypothetical protein
MPLASTGTAGLTVQPGDSPLQRYLHDTDMESKKMGSFGREKKRKKRKKRWRSSSPETLTSGIEERI